MKEFLVETNQMLGGIQKIYKFENGYGASVIRHRGSYGFEEGKWEIAPWDSQREFIGQYMLDWSDDVKGRLNDPEVDRILRLVQQL